MCAVRRLRSRVPLTPFGRISAQGIGWWSMNVFREPGKHCPICTRSYDAAFVQKILSAKPLALAPMTAERFNQWLRDVG